MLSQAQNRISAFIPILTKVASFGGSSKKGNEACIDLHLLTRTQCRTSEQAEQSLLWLHCKLFLNEVSFSSTLLKVALILFGFFIFIFIFFFSQKLNTKQRL